MVAFRERTRRPVLIVEDHADSLRMMCDFFEWAGIDCVTASNGETALEALRTHRPCLVLLDLMMPVMDGWRFRDEQRRLDDPELASVPVIVLTATTAQKADAARLDPFAILPKPVDLDHLLELVRPIVEGPTEAPPNVTV